MNNCEKVYEVLGSMGIEFEIVEHPPVFTTEEADSYIEGMEGVRTKTLLLCNRKKSRFFMIIMDGGKRLDMKELCVILEEKGMQFASEERLLEKVNLRPGAVSVFGLLNNKEKDIKIYFDKEIVTEKIMTFHPNDNTKTLFIHTQDLFKFIKVLGYEYQKINL